MPRNRLNQHAQKNNQKVKIPPLVIEREPGPIAGALDKIRAAEKAIATDPRRYILGAQVGPLLRSAGGYIQKFEFGRIEINNTDIPEPYTCPAYYAVDISIAAVKCFGSEDPGGIFDGGEGEDEPYIIATIINPAGAFCDAPGNISMTWRSPTFQNIEKGDIFCQNQLMFRDITIGRHGVYLKIALLDHEHGSEEDVRNKIEEQAAKAAKGIQDIASSLLGVNIDDALSDQALDNGIVDTLGDISLDLLTNILKDDKIDEKTWLLPSDLLKNWVDQGTYTTSGVNYPETELPPHIDTNFPCENVFDKTWLFSGGGGSYKIYLLVTPYRSPEKMFSLPKPN